MSRLLKLIPVSAVTYIRRVVLAEDRSVMAGTITQTQGNEPLFRSGMKPIVLSIEELEQIITFMRNGLGK